MNFENNVDLLNPSRGQGCVEGQNPFFHCVLGFILVDLIYMYNMTTFREEKQTIDPTPWVNGTCKCKIFASVILYASIPFDLVT